MYRYYKIVETKGFLSIAQTYVSYFTQIGYSKEIAQRLVFELIDDFLKNFIMQSAHEHRLIEESYGREVYLLSISLVDHSPLLPKQLRVMASFFDKLTCIYEVLEYRREMHLISFKLYR